LSASAAARLMYMLLHLLSSSKGPNFEKLHYLLRRYIIACFVLN
jgi:hypothetical protein